MNKKYNWGIVGASSIAEDFVIGLMSVKNAVFYGVFSRNYEKTEEFCKKFSGMKSYKSYIDLLKDDKIDIVYIATPNNTHAEMSKLALNYNKHVLCEKPFACSKAEAEEIFSLAYIKKLFCMEALWTRFFPLIKDVKKIIDDGELGELKLLNASLGYPSARTYEQNLQNKSGALFDLGVYLVSLAIYLFGKPIKHNAIINYTSQKLDTDVLLNLAFEEQKIANLCCSINGYLSNEIIIIGSKKTLKIHNPLISPYKISIKNNINNIDNNKKIIKQKIKNNIIIKKIIEKSENIVNLSFYKERVRIIPYIGNGYNYEAIEMMRCIDEGFIESLLMSQNDTLLTLEIMEKILC